MQDLKGLTLAEFEKKANVIIGRAEIDRNGAGDYVELEDLTSHNIQSNITNIFLKTCAWTFDITLLNTKDRYSFYDKGASRYNYIKEGRRIKLYLGIKKDNATDYDWSWIYGIIDKAVTTYNAEGEICNITGRDYIAYLSEIYLKKLWWGKNKKYDIVADQEKYDMPADCEGIRKVFIDSTGARTDFREITLNSEYTYDWGTNQLVFLHPSVPHENANGCLWLYYFTKQIVENLVADMLIEAGVLNSTAKYAWLNNSGLVTPTGKYVNRAWYEKGTNYIDAISLLAERIIYRFYIDGLGNPCFRGVPVLLTETAKRIDDGEYTIKRTEERLDELYNHFILIGERREMKKMNLSVIAYTAVHDLGTDTGELRGAILDNGGYTLTKKGFKWQGEGEAEQEWHSTNSSIGLYKHVITGLTPGTEYKFCAFGENNNGQYKQTPWVYFETLSEE